MFLHLSDIHIKEDGKSGLSAQLMKLLKDIENQVKENKEKLDDFFFKEDSNKKECHKILGNYEEQINENLCSFLKKLNIKFKSF